MKVTLDLDDLVHFKQGIDTLDDWERKVMFDAAGIAEERILTRLRTYPPQQKRKLPAGIPKSGAQARKIAMLYKAGKVPYVRTGNHGSGWRAKVSEVSSQSGVGTSLAVDFENLTKKAETWVVVSGKRRTLKTDTGRTPYAARLRHPAYQYRMFKGYWANLDTILKDEGKYIRDAFRDGAAWLGKNLVRK